MHLCRSIPKLTRKCDNLGNNQFGNTSRIGKWGVKDGDTMACGIFKVHLVCSNAEAANDEKIFSFSQDSLVQFRFGSYANDVNISIFFVLLVIQATLQHCYMDASGSRHAYRIFSINLSSGKEVLSASTW